MCEMQWFQVPVPVDLSHPTLLGKGERVLSDGENRWEGNVGIQGKDWRGVQFRSPGFVGSVGLVCLFHSQQWGKPPVPWAGLRVACTRCSHTLSLVRLSQSVTNERAVTYRHWTRVLQRHCLQSCIPATWFLNFKNMHGACMFSFRSGMCFWSKSHCYCYLLLLVTFSSCLFKSI